MTARQDVDFMVCSSTWLFVPGAGVLFGCAGHPPPETGYRQRVGKAVWFLHIRSNCAPLPPAIMSGGGFVSPLATVMRASGEIRLPFCRGSDSAHMGCVVLVWPGGPGV